MEDIKPNDTIRDYQLCVSNQDGEIFNYNYDIIHCREIDKDDKQLKGIGENYNIYYLINERDLPADISWRVNEPQGIYKKTFEFLDKIDFWKNNS